MLSKAILPGRGRLLPWLDNLTDKLLGDAGSRKQPGRPPAFDASWKCPASDPPSAVV